GLAGRRLDDAQPWVDGLLPGGVRLHAILPPVVAGGAHISLRVPRRVSPSLDELTSWGMATAAQTRTLRAIIADRVAFLVCGGTGSGKTTLLSALLAEIPTAERLLVVEDVRELRIAHEHTVYLQSRPANVEGAGAVTMVDLVRQALRMRPDRLVVGEVRGAEVRDLLMALNTGHEGGCGTVHANGARDVLPRLEALGALAGMGPEVVQAQVRSALQAIVHVRRDDDGARVVESITGLDGRSW
uniref:CpaF family protein n=1 Tax=Kribbia dieselivorans TaxID=331526 RepID=UPI000839127E